MKLRLSLALAVVSVSALFGQGLPGDNVANLFTEAKEQMQAGDYQAANVSFRKMLATGVTLPEEMCYFFAQTLFNVEQFQNAKEFAHKYIKLAGSTGEHYQASLDLLQKLESKLVSAKTCAKCDAFGYTLMHCERCGGEGEYVKTCHFCEGNNELHCSKCNGDGVLITLDAVGERFYNSCKKCGGKGYHPCTYCEGTGKLTQQCEQCFGIGKRTSNELCDHIIK